MSDPAPQPILQLGSGLDTLATHPISTIPFASDAFFKRELSIWRDCWLMVGRAADVDEPGQYLTLDLKCLNVPIAVLRSRDGQLRAFYNVCSHRGSRLLLDSEGSVGAIRCRFHGWTFSLDGELRGIPERELFPCIDDTSRYNLRQLAVDTWGGFVFVNMNPSPRHTLAQYLAGMPPKLDAYLGDGQWQWYTGYQRTFHANWKDLLNIQHEGYHASHVHRKTLGVQFNRNDCRNTVFPDSPGVCSLLTVLRPEMSAELLARMTTIQRLSMKYGTTSNWVDQDTSVAGQRSFGAVNHEQSDRWVFDCYTIYPNLMLFVGMDVLSVMRVWAVDAHQADWEWDWFFKDALANFGNLFNREHGRLATRDALSEDWSVAEWTHQNLRSGLVRETPVGYDMEATVRAHYEKLLMHMGLNEAELARVDA